MTEAATRSPARPGTVGWDVRPARTEDVPAVAAAVAALLAELGGTPPARAAIEAEARAHIEDPSLGIVLVAAAARAGAGAPAGSLAPAQALAPAGPLAPAQALAPAGPIAPVQVPAPPVSSQKSPHSDENCELAGEDRAGAGLVGVLTASWARAIQVAGRLLTIEVLWTRREWRDRGVGAALVEALAAAAAAEGAGRVEVGLPREGFPALRATERFYLANGFERLGPRMRRAVP